VHFQSYDKARFIEPALRLVVTREEAEKFDTLKDQRDTIGAILARFTVASQREGERRDVRVHF